MTSCSSVSSQACLPHTPVTVPSFPRLRSILFCSGQYLFHIPLPETFSLLFLNSYLYYDPFQLILPCIKVIYTRAITDF